MTNETIDLPDDVMARAAQDFFATEWASAREAAGFRFRPGTDITADCPPQDPATLIRLIRPYVARLARAWETCVGTTFRLMEIPEGRWAEALYYVLMACRGHGVGLADPFETNIDIAESKLCRGIDLSPFTDDLLDFYCLASDVVEAEARRPGTDHDAGPPFRSGDRVRVDTRLPTGDRATGTGTIVRWVVAGDPLSGCEGAVVAMDEDEQTEPWCYRGMAIFVPQGECERTG
jgi:hypothetical protein